MNKTTKYILIALVLAIPIALFYQNCGKGGEENQAQNTCVDTRISNQATKYEFTKREGSYNYNVVLTFNAARGSTGSADIAKNNPTASACRGSSISSDVMDKIKDYAATLSYCGPSARDVEFKATGGVDSNYAKPSHDVVQGKWDEFEAEFDKIANSCTQTSSNGEPPPAQPSAYPY